MTKKQPQQSMDLTDLAQRALALKEQIADLEQHLDAIKVLFRALGPGTHTLGNVTVTVTPNYRFDPDRAAEVIDVNLQHQMIKTVIDREKAKALLPPAVYQKCQREYPNPRVAIEEG